MFRLTRHGWREMLIGSVILAVIALGLGLWKPPLALVVLPIFLWLFAFFRDPDRALPQDPRAIVAPADGRVSDITDIEHDPLVGGPAVRIGIFLSVFNVHVNRCPCDGRVLAVQYQKGKFISALSHGRASAENESNTIVLAEPAGDQPVVIIKQIAGAIARRIVCTISPGDAVVRGQRIGMIKFGSRTELTIAKRLEPTVAVRVGQAVRGAADVVALWGSPMQTVATREMTA
ncbi:MAG: phosphatidylserine decarboxylase [Tepidisphaeraceae bacterium]|jgi:phosphatidylserine decarboxylase